MQIFFMNTNIIQTDKMAGGTTIVIRHLRKLGYGKSKLQSTEVSNIPEIQYHLLKVRK